jgi:hypothetical protein
MTIKTAVELHKDGTRVVYHERIAPADKRRDAALAGRVTHAWTHEDTKAARAACVTCQGHDVVPKEMR